MTKSKTRAKPNRKAALSSSARKKASSRPITVKTAPASTLDRALKLPRAGSSNGVAKTRSLRTDTKQSRVLALLRGINGATIETIMNATGWQQHSVRGFLAGIVRKRLKLDFDSELVDGVRRYRIRQTTSDLRASKSPKAA